MAESILIFLFLMTLLKKNMNQIK